MTTALAHLDILRCPACTGALTAAADETALVCAEHGSFPIRQGIVCFAGSETPFDLHWQANEAGALPASKTAGAARFLAPMIERLGAGEARILDAGCGDGVHLAALQATRADARVAAIDISLAALLAARTRRAKPWLPVQGDVLALPFASGTFDAVFAYGVLAYTADPWKGLSEMVRVTKPGGLVGLWMYPRPAGLGGLLLNLTRAIAVRLPEFLQRRLADVIVPFVGLLPTSSGVSLANASWAQCREVILVNIAPRILQFPTEQEIRQYLDANGLHLVACDVTSPVTLWAKKATQPNSMG